MLIISHIIVFFLTISIIIIAHELGHYFIARYFKVPVHDFSLGFGKIIWQKYKTKQIDKTNFQIRLLPLGGFVNLDLSSNYKLWQRSLIILAGPIFGVVFGLVLLIMSLQIGFKIQKPEIYQIAPNSPASQAKVQSKEVIIAINDHKINHLGELYMFLLKDLNYKGSFTLTTTDKKSQNGEFKKYKIEYELNKLLNEEDPIKKFGIIPYKLETELARSLHTKLFNLSFIDAFYYALSTGYLIFIMTFIILYKIILGILPLSMLVGPLGVAVITKKSLAAGFAIFLYLIGSMSIGFSAINLLPIPGLDGSQLVYNSIEKITGKPISSPLQILLRDLSIAFLIVMSGLVLSNDLERLIF